MAQSHLSSPLILGQAGQDWLSACLKATQEVFYTLQSWRGCRGCKPPELPQPLLSANLSTALLCSPALLMTPALVTRNPLQLLLLEVKEQLKSEKKKYCLLHLHVEGNISLTNSFILFWIKPIFNYSS